MIDKFSLREHSIYLFTKMVEEQIDKFQPSGNSLSCKQCLNVFTMRNTTLEMHNLSVSDMRKIVISGIEYCIPKLPDRFKYISIYERIVPNFLIRYVYIFSTKKGLLPYSDTSLSFPVIDLEIIHKEEYWS